MAGGVTRELALMTAQVLSVEYLRCWEFLADIVLQGIGATRADARMTVPTASAVCRRMEVFVAPARLTLVGGATEACVNMTALADSVDSLRT